jgi:hypothetical protein
VRHLWNVDDQSSEPLEDEQSIQHHPCQVSWRSVSRLYSPLPGSQLTRTATTGSPENSTSTSRSSSVPPFSTTQSSSTSLSPPPPTSPGPSEPSGPSGASQTRPSHENQAGIIAGSVADGIAGIAIIGGILAFFLIRRRKKYPYEIPPVAYADICAIFPKGESTKEADRMPFY